MKGKPLHSKPTFPTLLWIARVPEVWLATVVSCLQMFVNISIPTFLRLLIDYAVPMKNEVAFHWFMGGTAAGVFLYSLLRSNVRFLQGEAKDRAEIRLWEMKSQRTVEAMAVADWNRVSRLSSIPRDNVTRTAELFANLPSQVVAGSLYLLALVLALYFTTGPIAVVIVLGVVALKGIDLWVGGRQASTQEGRADAMSRVLRTENEIMRSAQTVFGIHPQGLFGEDWKNGMVSLAKAMRELRFKELYQYSYLFLSSEMLFLFSFWVAGTQSMRGEITFGQFVFVVTLLLQLAQPLAMVMDGLMDLKRTWGISRDLFDALEGEVTGSTPSFVPQQHPLPELPFRLAVAGPSGSGKTTLLESWYRTWSLGRGGRVCMVPQQLFLYSAPATRYCASAPAGEPLGIGALLRDSRPSEVLSGGERRRLMVLRALESKPNILILDEPEAGLDEHSRQRLLAYLQGELKRRPDMGFVVVSHDARFLGLAETRIELAKAEEKTHAVG